MQKNALSNCGDLVRQNDPDRFLLSLFVPAEKREDIWTLFAFNYEISKTRDVVSESTLGLIRLQWWRDQVSAIYGGAEPPAHEILKPLAHAIHTYALPQEDFETLIYAREFDLENVLPGNLEGLINYADFTTTPLLRLAMRIMEEDPDILPLQPIAVNYTLANLLRHVPHYAQKGRCLLPENLLTKEGLTKDNILNYEQTEKIPPIIRQIAIAQVKGIKTHNSFLKASDILANIYILQLKGVKYNVFNSKLSIPPAFKTLRLWFRTKFI